MTRFKKLKEKIESKPYRSDITYDELRKYLNYYGYWLDRTNGSHHSFVNIRHKRITFPVHDNTIKAKYIQLISNCVKQEEDDE